MDPLVLIVDDDPDVRDLLAEHVRGCNFRVQECRDGREALRFLEGHSPDIALVDLHMPYVDGLAVLRVIRQRHARCQVMLMSGAGTLDDAGAAMKLGAREYLKKPFELAALRTILNAIKNELVATRGIDTPSSRNV